MGGIAFGREAAFVVAGWLGLVLVASLQPMLPPPRLWFPLVTPNVALLVVIFAGLAARGTLAGTCALACAIGYLADLFAGSPKGLHMLVYALLGVGVRAVSARLLVNGRLVTALITGAFTAIAGVVLVLLRSAVGHGATLGLLRRVPLEVLATAIVAPFVFRLLRRLERLFAREVRVLPAG